jgi:beta-galactosidase GanA
MKILIKSAILLLGLLSSIAGNCQPSAPSLRPKGNGMELLVNGKPFLVLGGELGNSTATTMENMISVWPKLRSMNLNTVLIPVYWELIEPEEGKFDFSLPASLITEARKNELKIVFLWFGSWKNSMSTHIPPRMKTDTAKYARAMDDKGIKQEILSPFSENNLAADLQAFQKFMEFLRDFDSKDQTVVMVQVENETAMLPVARDHSPLAEEAFLKDVPWELIHYMHANIDKLVPELLNAWKEQGYKTTGNWETVFGKSLFTDEVFMAWYFSLYTNKIAEAGKKVYPIPMYVNVALNRPGKLPGSGYPAGGPLPHLMDVWKAAGNSIDFLAPDIYFSDFQHWCDLYTRQGDPLFIPEIRFDNTVAAKAVFAMGHYKALGFSPFSVETTGETETSDLAKAYALITQLTPVILANSGTDKTEGVLLSKTNPDTVIVLGNYKFTFRHEFTLGWSAGANEETWPMAAALIIQTSDNAFWLAGTGFVATLETAENPELKVGLLKVEEGRFTDGNWKVIRFLNGDQTHQGRHIRIPAGEYGIQRVDLYTY